MEKTVLHQLIDDLYSINPDIIKELDVDIYLEMEKDAMCDFWIEGNKDGWSMRSDWPEDATHLYNDKFKETVKYHKLLTP